MAFTLKHIEERLAAGKIKGFTDNTKTAKPNSQKESKNIPGEVKASKRKAQKIKEWMTLHLDHWCDAHRLELYHAGSDKGEFMFDPERLWRFDWAIPKKKLAFEYEGINAQKSRHTTKTGYTGDVEKYNEAAAQGWKVLRYTALNYKQLLTDLNRML
jgi:hypothetical protein